MKSPDQSASTPDSRATAPTQQQQFQRQGAAAAQNQQQPSALDRAEQTDQSAGSNPASGLNQRTTSEHAAGAFKQTPTGRSHAPYAEEGEGSEKGSSPMPTWQSAVTAVRDTARTAWAALPARVRTASPTTLALGAAAVGAAVWLGTRKSKSGAEARYSQKSTDRWADMKQKAKAASNSGGHHDQSSQDSW